MEKVITRVLQLVITPDSEMNRESNEDKILRLLNNGDSINMVFNCGRVDTLDISEGILIFGDDSMYYIHNYFLGPDGDYVDIDTLSPGEKAGISPSAGLSETTVRKGPISSTQRYSAKSWGNEDISEIHNRQFLLRNVAIEIFLADGRSYFFTFLNTSVRDDIYNRLVLRLSESASNPTELTPSMYRFFGIRPLQVLTDKWCAREISNFEYLMKLNTIAGIILLSH
jgi:hypothetical protein